eukprot:TRINITY_DN32889_c0_g1_i4.p1 TRINITY_DN32889_c0_g1~~TRINITY_DN32889_c0_g1_i4.p1  ORF type:complete len:104 (-),score=12.29 TRINITY_DN32889_c0_g1_i4:11-322(-)
MKWKSQLRRLMQVRRRRCLRHIMELLRYQKSIRVRNYLTKKCLPSHELSAWTVLYKSGDNKGFLTTMGVTNKVFHYLLNALNLEIGRAVQQECRDRSRMPSSA